MSLPCFCHRGLTCQYNRCGWHDFTWQSLWCHVSPTSVFWTWMFVTQKIYNSVSVVMASCVWCCNKPDNPVRAMVLSEHRYWYFVISVCLPLWLWLSDGLLQSCKDYQLQRWVFLQLWGVVSQPCPSPPSYQPGASLVRADGGRPRTSTRGDLVFHIFIFISQNFPPPFWKLCPSHFLHFIIAVNFVG